MALGTGEKGMNAGAVQERGGAEGKREGDRDKEAGGKGKSEHKVWSAKPV
jgi:hypothetical protein